MVDEKVIAEIDGYFVEFEQSFQNGGINHLEKR